MDIEKVLKHLKEAAEANTKMSEEYKDDEENQKEYGFCKGKAEAFLCAALYIASLQLEDTLNKLK